MRPIFRLLSYLFFTAAVICSFFFLRVYQQSLHEIADYSNIQNQYTVIVNDANLDNNTTSVDEPLEFSSETLDLPLIEVDFPSLLDINPDTIGWITIPGTVVNYPVVKTDSNSKYLDISFEGKRTTTGTLFVDKDNDIRGHDTNTTIYGHNMGYSRNDMFSSLLQYKNKEYFYSHRYIQFDTIYQSKCWWKVFAVVEYNVLDETFNPIQSNFTTETDFMNWFEKISISSLYEIDNEISYNDKILTLLTCDKSKYSKNGRLIVFAVKLN